MLTDAAGLVRDLTAELAAGFATSAGCESSAELVQTMPDDVAERLDAGHNLAAAMYYDRGRPGDDRRWWNGAGDGMVSAYAHACNLFHIGDGPRVGRQDDRPPSGPAENRGRCLKQVQCGREHGHDGGCEA